LNNCKFVDDRALLHIAGLSRLDSLDLSKCPRITNFGVSHLKVLSNLKVLNLSGLHISDMAIEHFQNFKNLQELNLSRTDATDLAIQKLSRYCVRCTLARLFLTGTKITNSGLSLLSEFPSLEYVTVAATLVTSLGIKSLKSDIEAKYRNVIRVKIIQGMTIAIHRAVYEGKSFVKSPQRQHPTVSLINTDTIHYLEQLGSHQTTSRRMSTHDPFLFSTWQPEDNPPSSSTVSPPVCVPSSALTCQPLRSIPLPTATSPSSLAACDVFELKENISPHLYGSHLHVNDNDTSSSSESQNNTITYKTRDENDEEHIFNFAVAHSCPPLTSASSLHTLSEAESAHETKCSFVDEQQLATELTKAIEDYIVAQNLTNDNIKVLPPLEGTSEPPTKAARTVSAILDKVFGRKHRI
jgi:hypothetical protein